MRLFIAIPLPQQVKEQLLDRKAIDGVKWQRPDQMHITLKFLGDTDIDLIGDLKEGLGNIEFPEFSLMINGFGYFPEGKQPKVLWAGIDRSRLLEKLYQEIEEVCNRLGFESETRSFKPHITIGRIKRASKEVVDQFINQHKQVQIPDIPVEEFALYESKLNPKGAKYLRLQTFQLQHN